MPEEQQHNGEPRVHLEGSACDGGRTYQAGRDQFVAERDLHLHYRHGVHSGRRTDADGLGDECPYPGMASFGTEEARWFFGRDIATARLTARLDERLQEGGPLALVASSGAGKSSLLMAGLLPALKRGALPGSRHWPVLAFTPTARPLEALTAQIRTLTETTVDDINGRLAAGFESAAEVLRDALRTPPRNDGPMNARLVVVVDQFEELFTLCTDDRERDSLLGFLSHISATGSGDEPLAAVVYGLRADFYAQCVGHPQVRGVLEDGQLLLGPMTQAELREAILYPAEEAGLEVEPGLIELLLRDLGATTDGAGAGARGYKPGRLPLLAHTLRATWTQRHGSTLTVAGYEATGGIHHAVADTAERLYTRLGPDAQSVTRTLFLRLIKVGDGVEDTRRHMLRRDLLGGLDPALAQAAVDTFTHSRLLSQEQDTVEITHEALLHAWPRLRSWIDTDRVGHLIRQELEQTAATWKRDGYDQSLLYRGNRLEAVRTWGAHPDDLSHTASAFVCASLSQERRTATWRRALIAVLVTLTLLACGTAVYAFRLRDTAQAQRDEAVAHSLLTDADRLRDTDASLAAQLELAAHRTHASPSTYTALVSASGAALSTPLRGHHGIIETVAYHPEGHTLASASYDGTVRLWNVTDPTRPPTSRTVRVSHSGPVYSVAYNSDGHLIATAGEDGTVRLWDITTQNGPRLVGHIPGKTTGPAYAVSFHPDMRTLITVRARSRSISSLNDTMVEMWNVADPANPVPFAEPVGSLSGWPSPAMSSKKGRTLVRKDNRLWDITDPAEPARLDRPVLRRSSTPPRMALSPNGRLLAVTGGAKGVQLWNLSDPTASSPLSNLDGHTNAVTALAFSRDGRTLATGSSDRTALLWNVDNPNNPVRLGDPLTGHTEQVYSIAFSPDGHTLATASGDHTVRLWSRPQPALITGHNSLINSVAYSPDSRILATAASDLRLWDITDSDNPTLLGKPLLPTGRVSRTGAEDSGAGSYTDEEGHMGEEFYAVAFAADGRTMATAGFLGVMLWDVRKPSDPKALSKPFSHDSFQGSVAFTPDGKMLVAANSGGVTLWDITDPRQPRRFGDALTDQAVRAVLSPDGKTLATVTDSEAGEGVRLWDITDPVMPRVLGRLQESGQPVISVAFSPMGDMLVSGGEKGTVRLWGITNPSDPTPLGAPFTHHANAVRTLAFSPDGQTLASGSKDGTVRLSHVENHRGMEPSDRPLRASANWVSVNFDSTGRTLMTVGNQMVHLYQSDANQAAQRVCRVAADSLTRSIWRKHIPTLSFTPPCLESGHTGQAVGRR
ncbi:NACHT and WD repeat domain-containing protein [Streptomyces caeruleatus]|uniref:Novel STAND NTPase 1 domain-containing protein n=1 Tax=Streptomyces caeruleatus TaxID=661399 RepID=A0A101U8A2_9ACTN|nr:WD40 repeat domain-containing protein [Streptomyces caeruleatus]KUO06073.1 hypothetical protein AQJ67_04565 [Streptomyces caeruleatus]